MIDSHQIENGGVQVVDVRSLLDSLVAEVVRGAVDHPLLDATTGQPYRETIRIMIAAIHHPAHGFVGRLDGGRTSEFSAADDQRILQHSALLQVFDHRREGLIGILSELAIGQNVGMRIPRIALAVVNLRHAHTFFRESHRHQTSQSGTAWAIHIEHCFAFFCDIEDIRSRGLHAIGGLHGFNGTLQLRVLIAKRLQIHLVQLFEKVDVASLNRWIYIGTGDIRNHLGCIERLPFNPFVLDVRALIHGRQECRAPQRTADSKGLRRTEHHITGQILVLNAKAIGDPGTHRRPADNVGASVHHRDARLVVRNLRIHGAHHANLIGHSTDMRPKLAQLGSGLAVFLKTERRLH